MVTRMRAYCGKDSLRKFCWETAPNLGMSVCPSNARNYSHRCTWMIKKESGRKQNTSSMWKILMKLADVGEPTSFLDHVYLGCTRRECKPNETIADEYRRMFESRISAGATEKITPRCEKLHAQTVAWSNDMEDHT